MKIMDKELLVLELKALMKKQVEELAEFAKKHDTKSHNIMYVSINSASFDDEVDNKFLVSVNSGYKVDVLFLLSCAYVENVVRVLGSKKEMKKFIDTSLLPFINSKL